MSASVEFLECAAAGAAADRRQKGHLVAFGQRRRGRGEFLIQSQNHARRHPTQAGKTTGVKIEDQPQPAAFRDVERVLAEADDIAQDAKE